MARYLSKSESYKRTVRQPVTTLVAGPAGPEVHPVREAIMAEFQKGGLTAHERELARQTFFFRGLAEGENPLSRVSLFDTDVEARLQGWTDETKAEIEAALDSGRNEWYFRVEEQRLPTPWPLYDKQTPKQIVETLKATGSDPEYVAAYERENKNRATVLTELAAIDPEESELLTA